MKKELKKQKKVSIIVPCYNMEKYIAQFLESVIEQKYENIELILVNDGSIDNTERIILQYKKKLETNGIQLVYIFQENKGLGAAMNTGLAIFTGDYLTWCDPDDFFSKDSIEKKVNFLENNPKYGFVRTDCYMFNENDLVNPIILLTDATIPEGASNHSHPERFKEDLFEDIILEKSIFITPGCYMIRREAFLKANPHCYIYPAKRGQNFQMLLPVAYQNKCGFIDEPLFNYVIRNKSMSHTDDTFDKIIFRCNEHEEILRNVINSIKEIDININTNYYYKMIEEKYINRKIYFSCINNNIIFLKSFLEDLISKNYKLNDESKIGLKYLFGETLKNIEDVKKIYTMLPTKMKKVLFISSTGGHLSELLQLESMFSKYDFHIITEKTKSNLKLREKYPNKVNYLIYGTKAHLLVYPLKLLANCFISLFLYFKIRPKIIITTGAHTAGPMCCIGKIFGSKIIFIESFANIKTKTITGKLIYLFADLFIVQWKSMLKLYPKAKYGGWIY